ncbi:hypothetical protein [Kribbella endophytica]
MNGQRGSRATEAEARELAADLELQYGTHGPRDPKTVRRLAEPVAVDVWQHEAGVLDAWVQEGGQWIGRVRLADGAVSWVGQDELRPSDAAAGGSDRTGGMA